MMKEETTMKRSDDLSQAFALVSLSLDALPLTM
jgi:hypothetical protein